MPATDSLLFQEPFTDTAEELELNGCCQFLHTTPDYYGGVVLTKYLVHHEDKTELFERWLEFISSKFEISLSSKRIKVPVRGWLTLKQFHEVVQNHLKDFPNLKSYQNVSKHSGVNTRRENACILKNKHGHLVVALYNKHLTQYNGREAVKYERLMDVDTIPEYKVPAVQVSFKTDIPENHNTLKYLNWYLVRLFQENIQLVNFLLDNEEKLSKLVEEYKTGWYNILFILLKFTNNSGISAIVSRKIDLASIKDAFEEYIGNEEYYEDRDYYEDDDEYYEDDDFNYVEHEVPVNYSLELAYGTKNHDKKREIISLISETTRLNPDDTINGKFSKKDSNRYGDAIVRYLKIMNKNE